MRRRCRIDDLHAAWHSSCMCSLRDTQMSFHRTPQARKKPLNSNVCTGLVLNKKELRRFKDIAYENRNVEYLYLRENEFTVFDPYIQLPELKVLDLSINNLVGRVEFLPNLPKLRHLYLTGNQIESFEGFSDLPFLETLAISDNNISSFEFLENLPSLRVLSVAFNQIDSFRHYPFLPELHTLNLRGNPVAEFDSCRKMAIATSPATLVSIDDQPITDDERREVDFYRGKLVYCITEGMVVEGDQPEEQADTFILAAQRDTWKAAALSLQAISLTPADGSNVITEGRPVKLNVCLQDVRPLDERAAMFHSRHLFPVSFKVHGDAKEVLVVGEMNRWTDPIALERCEENGEVYFQNMLYLPTGNYEYRYIVDGEEKLSDAKTKSKYGQGPCNIHEVKEAVQNEDTEQTILYLRWLRCNESNGFDLIDGENGLTYTPTQADIGQCLRAEVLAYVDGEFSFLYFDISSPVSAGAPICTKLSIEGEPAEGAALSVEALYAGGREGNSLLRWFRVDDDGNETPLDLKDPWGSYACALDDIGKKIKVAYTPVREDNEAGEEVTAITGPVIPGVPTCRALSIDGEARQDSTLTAIAQYSGGIEGASQYQWFRHDDVTHQFFPIAGETGATYMCTLQDVKRKIAVEYTPISAQGVIGEVNRCETSGPVLPGVPAIVDVKVVGSPIAEETLVTVEYQYTGGYAGIAEVKWFCEKGGQRNQIGRPNHTTCTLTRAEVGGVIAVEVTPVRDDGAKGKVAKATTEQPVAAGAPEIRDLVVKHKTSPPGVGTVLELDYKYFGGEPSAEHEVKWERSIDDGWEMIARSKKMYAVVEADLGHMIRVTVVPKRNDGAEGPGKQRLVDVPAPEPAPEPEPAAQEQPAENTAAAEQPADNAAASEQPAENAATTEQPAEDAAASEQPADNAAASEQPAEGEQQADAPAAESQPAEAQSAEAQPAAAEPADSQPADTAATEQPASDSQAAEAPASNDAQPATESAEAQPAAAESETQPAAENPPAENQQPAAESEPAASENQPAA